MRCWGTARCRSTCWTRKEAAGLTAKENNFSGRPYKSEHTAFHSMRVAGHARAAATHEEIRIRPFIRLLDMFDVQLQPAAIRKGRRSPLCAPGGESLVVHVQTKQTLGYVESDRIPGLNQSERSAGRGFWAGVQNYGSIGRAAHAGVGNTDHIADTFAEDFRRQHHVADLRHSGVTPRATILQHHYTVFIDVQLLLINPSVKFLNGFEHNGSAAVLQQVRTGG